MTNDKQNHYDYFVIGAGSGGVRSARIAASHGAKVGIAESRFFGGTCVNVGCVPKKLLSYAADYHAHVEDAVGYGWSTINMKFDWATLRENKNVEISRLNDIYVSLLNKAGVTIHNGFAKFLDSNTIEIDGQIITADYFLIATGGKPRMPNIEGADHMISSDDAFYLESLPKHIAIYGGGYIGVEFAHIFHGLGCKVSLIHRGDNILRGFDHDIRNHLKNEMEKQGIHLILETTIESLNKNSDKGLEINLSNDTTLNCDMAMSAVGRIPETHPLNLADAGIKTKDSGHIQVNDRYQTNIPHIHAVGDIIGRVELTPVAIKEGHWLADTLFGNIKRPAPDYDTIPTAVFSRPNIGTVGLTEEQAKEKGIDVKVFKSEFKPMVHTLSKRDERTFIKMIIDKTSDKVLGIHMCGLDSSEILQGFAVAIKAGATKSVFDETIGIHPTSAEELVTLK